jgi:hypothetical protein
MKKLILLGTHALMLAIGFAAGVYFLPILTAPKGPGQAALEASAAGAEFTAEFTKDLPGSDFLHWGEGNIALSTTQITHMGTLAPGPDYMLYLVPEFVDDEPSFENLKSQSLSLGSIKTFDGFILKTPEGTDLTAYTTVVVWCEAFGEFITSAKYR